MDKDQTETPRFTKLNTEKGTHFPRMHLKMVAYRREKEYEKGKQLKRNK